MCKIYLLNMLAIYIEDQRDEEKLTIRIFFEQCLMFYVWIQLMLGWSLDGENNPIVSR